MEDYVTIKKGADRRTRRIRHAMDELVYATVAKGDDKDLNAKGADKLEISFLSGKQYIFECESSELQKLKDRCNNNDKIILEASIIVHKRVGFRLNDFNFKSSKDQFSDGVLIIGDDRLHVNRGFLAVHSPVLAAKFYGVYKNENVKELRLPDVKLDHFQELLLVIYPSRRPISCYNVEFLLELGKNYEIRFIMDECEKFLIETKSIFTITKLCLADRYELATLQEICIGTFKYSAEIINLKSKYEYTELSNATKAALLEKLFKLSSM